MKVPYCQVCQKPVEKVILRNDPVLHRKEALISCHEDKLVIKKDPNSELILPETVFTNETDSST